jgi:hypothetical protein
MDISLLISLFVVCIWWGIRTYCDLRREVRR